VGIGNIRLPENDAEKKTHQRKMNISAGETAEHKEVWKKTPK